MKKYELLKYLGQTRDGILPKDIAEKSKTAPSNTYTYLRELAEEGLISKNAEGKIELNKSERRVEIILNTQSMAQGNFHELISPKFGALLEQFSKKLSHEGSTLNQTQKIKIKQLAIPKRIILKLSSRPSSFCLKVDEALTKQLLLFFGINPTFSQIEYEKLIEKTPIRKARLKPSSAESNPDVAKDCDRFHELGEDDLVSKISPFTPDERIVPLIEVATRVNKEYALFLNSLDENSRKNILEQWSNKYIYNTNSIEGNTMTEEEVEKYLKTGEQPPQVEKRELYETNNLRRALRFLETKKNEEISIDLIKEIHFQVQTDIRDDAGYFKASYNCVDNNPTTPPKFVETELSKLLQWYKENKATQHPVILASIMHMQFEIIHPFSDGNGRVGRLVLNHILRQTNFSPATIQQKTKEEYYRAIRNRSLPQFLLYFLTSFIEEYKR